MEVNATFVKGGKYRWHRNDWQLVTWETALPSRLEIRLPADLGQQLQTAKRTYHRFGQYSRALDKIRALIERKPLEKAELERMLSAMNVPGDFDIAQISWRPDYDSFFYQQLSRRARRIYLFRDEYIFAWRRSLWSKRRYLATPGICSPGPKTSMLFSPLIPRSQKTTFAIIARILGRSWDSWRGSFMAAIPAHGQGN
jgi:hypothetical protein